MPTIRSILSYSIYSMHARCSFWPSIVSCLIGPAQVSVEEHTCTDHASQQPCVWCPSAHPVECQCHRALELLSVEDSVKYVRGIDFQFSLALLALLRCQLRKTPVLPASNLVSGAPINVIWHRQFASASWRECFVYASTIDCQIQFLPMLNPGCAFFRRGLEVLHKV